MDDTVQINRSEIAAKISLMRSELAELESDLKSLDRLARFSQTIASPKPENRGRKVSTSSKKIESKMREFIMSQPGEFSNVDIRDAIGTVPKAVFGTAMRRLIDEGILKVKDRAVGRKLGRYFRGDLNGERDGEK